MKKQFWANILLVLIVCAACVSCSTISESEKNEIASTAIKLADRYCSLGEYDKALEVYENALSKSHDWRLAYNKAVILYNQKSYFKALDYCQSAYEQFQKIEFLNYMKKIAQEQGYTRTLVRVYDALYKAEPDKVQHLYDKINTLLIYDKKAAYALALEQWKTNRSLEIATVLYKVNPLEWKAVYKALGGNPEEK